MIEAHRDDPLDGDAIGLVHINPNMLVAMITAAIVTRACAWVPVRSEQGTIDQSDYRRIHISNVTCKREGGAVVGSDNVVAATTGESFATSVLRDFVSAERVLRRVLLYCVRCEENSSIMNRVKFASRGVESMLPPPSFVHEYVWA
jgi:hypothetical protein